MNMLTPRVAVSTTFDLETAEQLREIATRRGFKSSSSLVRALVLKALEEPRERETSALRLPAQEVCESDAPQAV